MKNSLDSIVAGEATAGISLRHAASAGGQVLIGGQIHDQGRVISNELLWQFEGTDLQPLELGIPMGGYIASVAASADGFLVAARNANQVLDVGLDGKLKQVHKFNQPTAVAKSSSGSLFVDSKNGLLSDGGNVRVAPDAEFDNHTIMIRI